MIKIITPVCLFILIIAASHNASAELPITNTSVEGIFGTLNWEPDALNSDSEVIGNYEVVVTTDPMVPAIDQVTHIQFKVFNYNQGPYGDNKLNYAAIGVNHFTMGVRIYQNDVLVHEFIPQYHDGSSWSTDYTFTNSGNHILKVDLYNFDKDNNVVTYVFNIPVSTKFGPIFQYVIITSAIAFAVILIWVKFVMRRKKTPHL
jgi:hypothetical protein